MSDYRNHSENSLRSNSSSCRFACLAYAIQESKMIPIIVHPINTSSCGMFLGLLSFSLISLSSLVHRLPHIVLHVLSLTFENILGCAKRFAITALRAPCFLTHCVRSKTFRTRRSLEECKFFESTLSLWLRNAIWGTKYEMLFERSEFIEWFEEFVFRPPSSGRFRTFLCFVSFGDERNENLLHT